MFNLDIVDTDVFLDMPQSSQMLYFHLGMRADDDGFVSPKKVMRLAGANHDDLQVLIAKRYVLQFDSGVVVIKHWPLNNYIQKDRYKPTTYVKEKESLMFNEFGAYSEIERMKTLVEEITTPNDEVSTTNERSNKPSRTQSVSKKDTQSRLGKVSIGKTKNITTDVVIGAEAPEEYGKPEINEMFDYWQEVCGYDITSNRQKNRNACKNLIKKHGAEKLQQLIRGVAMSQDDQYAPRISDFAGLQSKLNDLLVWGRRQGAKHGQAVDLTI
jgi:hypothetical protein